MMVVLEQDADQSIERALFGQAGPLGLVKLTTKEKQWTNQQTEQ